MRAIRAALLEIQKVGDNFAVIAHVKKHIDFVAIYALYGPATGLGVENTATNSLNGNHRI